MAIKKFITLDMHYLRLFLQPNLDQIKSKGQGVIPGIDRNSVMSSIGIKPTTVSSEITFLGLTANKEPILIHAHVSGISNGISSSIQRSIPSNFS